MPDKELFAKDDGGNSVVSRLNAELRCNADKADWNPVTDSSVTYGDLHKIDRAIQALREQGECSKHGGVNQYCSICLAERAEKIALSARPEPAQPAQPPICSICRVRVDQCEHAPAGTQAKQAACVECDGDGCNACEPAPATETARPTIEEFYEEWLTGLQHPILHDDELAITFAVAYHAAQRAAERERVDRELGPIKDVNDLARYCQDSRTGLVDAIREIKKFTNALRAERDQIVKSWKAEELVWKQNEHDYLIKQQQMQAGAEELIAERDEAQRQVAELREKAWKYDDLCR